MDILKFVKDKGIFVKFRIGPKPFDPSSVKRTTAYEDIKRKEKKDEDKPKGDTGVL